MAQVNSYNVANRSGAQVRGDLNDIFDAIKTCNSASSDPASPVKFMLYGDSGDDNLRIYDGVSQFRPIGKVTEDNLGLLSRSGGDMTGPLKIDDSTSSAAPALSFVGSADLGLFRKSANQMGFASSGTEQLFMDGDGITLNAQNEVRFGDSDSSNYVGIKAPSTVSSDKTITLPDETGTLLTSASSIANSNLANSSVTVGSTAISLGASATDIAGLTTLTSTNLQATNIKDASGNNSTTPAQIDNGRAKAWVNFDGRDGTLTDSDQSGVNSKFPSGLKVIKRTFPTGSTQANKNYYEIQIPAAVFKDANFVVTGSSGGLYNTSDGGIYLLPETADNNNGINSSKSSTRVSIGVVAPSGAFTTAPVINLMLFGESPD